MGTSMDERAGAGLQPVGEMSYTEASAELDAIVGFFEGRDVDVDQLVGRLVRATAIIEELDKRLRQTRVQVEQLVPRLTAVLEEVADEDRTAAGPGADGEPGPAGRDTGDVRTVRADGAGPPERRTSRPADDPGDLDGDGDRPGLF